MTKKWTMRMTSPPLHHVGKRRQRELVLPGRMRRRRGPLGCAQLCRACARIGGRLPLTRSDRALRQHLERWSCMAELRLMPRAAARARTIGEERLDDAVLQRMERHDHQPSAGFQDLFGREQRVLQLVELFIDED